MTTGPLATAAAIGRHVRFKVAAHELTPEVAGRMLAALEAGAPPDYPALLDAATWPAPPPVVYHTAPITARNRIAHRGLAACQPGQGGNWAPRPGTLCVALQASQPPGVYVAPGPDERGVWAHWPAWDVWAVERGRLPWRPDRLNPGCWSLAADVPPGRVRLHGAFGPGPVTPRG